MMVLAARQRLRQRLRDGAAGSAFAGVALSGRVPVWAAVIFVITLISSWFGWHPLAGRRASGAILLVAAALALFGMSGQPLPQLGGIGLQALEALAFFLR